MPPRFNHVAMSVPADALGDASRAEIVAFYKEVFGFEEYPMLTEDRKRLVLRAYTNEQFVFLIADDPPMSCPKLDHYGMSVQSLAELDEFEAKARAFAEKDHRVEVSERNLEDYGALKLHSVYIRYLLPLQIEIQHYEYVQSGPSHSPARSVGS
jgi:hypothetical protein